MTVTFVVPAYNEERNLAATVEGIVGAAAGIVPDYEVLIVNDGSRDRTGAIADELARQNPSVTVLHNPVNRGLGYNYIAGVKAARGEYVMMVPGDNEILPETVRSLLQRIGRADIVVPYIANYDARKPGRAVLSKLFTWGLNLLFGLRLRYYNGIVIHRTALIRSVPMKTHGFAYQADALVRLIRTGHSYVQAPMVIKPRDAGTSKALRPRNVVSVFQTVWSLFWEVRIRDRARYSGQAFEIPDASPGAP